MMKPADKRTADTWRPPSQRGHVPKVSGTYSTKSFVVDVGDLPYEEDELTPVRMACLVCKGHGFHTKENGTHYSRARCDWCTDGSMTSDQVNRYLNREQIKRQDIETMLRHYVKE